MEYNNHKEYIDDVIATSVGVDPIGMYYVQQKMDSLIHGNVNDLTVKEPIQEDYIDGLITTSVGVEPMAMYYVQQKMNSLINGKVNELTEKDPIMADCVDEIIEGIDRSINNQLLQNNLRQDYIWFECPMDLWLDSQPELKKALESLPQSVADNTKDDYVWFAEPLDKSIVSQLDARLADKHMHKSGINNDQQDYVWFEMILDKWIETQPGLKEALVKLRKMNKSDETINDDSNKLVNKNKVA